MDMRPVLLCGLALVLCVPALAGAGAGAGASRARIARVIDGDTVALTNGRRVRLVQIDSPEVRGGECYSAAATRELRRLLPVGARVGLEADPRLDHVDRYGRLLRYVRAGARNVNLELVRRGAATVWFYRGERGRYAAALLKAARAARSAHRGLWGACRAVWNPNGSAQTQPKGAAAAPSDTRCEPSYPDFCIPPPPPDLDCADVKRHNFRVVGADPHHFDGDHDGRGCE